MRCARCDRLAIPQAVGRMPNGQVVFGWCLDCMEAAGCVRIKRARGARAFRRRRRRPLTMEERRATGLALVALFLGLWGLVLAVVGIWKTLRPVRGHWNAYGNGTPSVLLVGGAALGIAGLTLAAVALAHARWFWRVLEWLLFACAVGILVLGIVRYDPRRAPWLAGLAGFAVALSVLIHQRVRLAIPHAQTDYPAKSAGLLHDEEPP